MYLFIYNLFFQEKKKDKDSEKEKKRKRRKTETDSEDEEKEDFQIFCVEERLTVAHRPNYQGSSSTTGTLYPALVSRLVCCIFKCITFNTQSLWVGYFT